MKLPATRTSRSSYFGAVDLAGLPKDRFYIYRSVWNPEAVTVHILPHWNWPDRIGKNVPVYVYTNGDSAELFLNGKSLGRRTKLVPDTPLNDKDYYAVTAQYRLMWNDVIYQPGELHAVAYKGGRKIGQAVVKTANKPAALRLMPESDSLIADGDDLAYIQVQALDAAGVPCPLADDLVHFEIDGPAGLAGVGNGDPRSYESFVVPQRHLFYGKAVLIVRSVRGGIGPVRITATADGLQTTTIELQAIAPKP
jgi:beta-galactosidase